VTQQRLLEPQVAAAVALHCCLAHQHVRVQARHQTAPLLLLLLLLLLVLLLLLLVLLLLLLVLLLLRLLWPPQWGQRAWAAP
jgi:hypothetical protein